MIDWYEGYDQKHKIQTHIFFKADENEACLNTAGPEKFLNGCEE